MTELQLEISVRAAYENIIQARNVTKVYQRGAEEVRAVDGISFEILEREFIAIAGPSGAGKTTLLQLIGAMDVPTTGQLLLRGKDLKGLNDSVLTQLRRDHIGFVFQHFGLLPTLTVAENVRLPRIFGKETKGANVDELLDRVGLSHRRDHRPSQLSGGEMQRVAIARALVNSPDLLLADEPTGTLDSATSELIIDLLSSLNREGLTIIVVTHNEFLADSAHRRITMRDGRIQP